MISSLFSSTLERWPTASKGPKSFVTRWYTLSWSRNPAHFTTPKNVFFWPFVPCVRQLNSGHGLTRKLNWFHIGFNIIIRFFTICCKWNYIFRFSMWHSLTIMDSMGFSFSVLVVVVDTITLQVRVVGGRYWTLWTSSLYDFFVIL